MHLFRFVQGIPHYEPKMEEFTFYATACTKVCASAKRCDKSASTSIRYDTVVSDARLIGLNGAYAAGTWLDVKGKEAVGGTLNAHAAHAAMPLGPG